MIDLIHGDCLVEMGKIPDASIDLVLTDPPYKVISGGNKQGFSHKNNSPNSRKVFKNNDGKLFKYNNIDVALWASECFRVLKEGTHFYTMVNNLNLKDTLVSCDNIGFKFHNLLLWKKNNVLTNRWYMKNCEYILFFRKGKSKGINNKSTKQVLEFKNIRDRVHPTQKPIELMEVLVGNSSGQEETVLDPFMGSGSTGVACKNLSRNFIGIEKEKKYFDIAKDRIGI